MHSPLTIRAALVACALAAPARPQSADSDLASSFSVPAGCAVSLWAQTPLFNNPTAIDIDPQGRVWVTEAVNYRQWEGRNPGLHRDEGDRVVVLEDKDGDGLAETSTVFAQDSDLVSPLGICWLPDKVLVSCSPTVWAYYDDDGDLHADRKEVFLTGFGGWNHDHGAHSFSVGPDGRLSMALGNAGPHMVTDKSGWTLRSGSVYDGGGPYLYGNKPGLVSDDGRVWVGGLILRCNQDATGLTVMAHNFRNPYEVAVDRFGDMWTFDNDDDGNECCRATWVMEGGNYGYFSADGSRYWQADRRPGQGVQAAHWHQDDPGVVPTSLITGSGGPTGVCVYQGDALPEPLRGALLCADAGRSCVYALCTGCVGSYDLREGLSALPAAAGAPLVSGAPAGSTPLTALIASKPARPGDESWHMFRPSDVCVAPDGSVLVADWYDPGVGGHRAQDGQAFGRLLRVAPVGAAPQLSRALPAFDSVKSVLAGLESPAQSVRALAWKAGLALGAGAVPALAEIAARDAKLPDGAPNWTARRDAMWLLSAFPSARPPERQPADNWSWAGLPPSGAQALAEMPVPVIELQSVKARALRVSGVPVPLLRRVLTDDVSFRAVLARALEDATWSECKPLLTAARNPTGRLVAERLGLAWRGKEHHFAASYWPERLKDPLAWDSNTAMLAWRLHPDELAPAFAQRVMAGSLEHDAREQSLTALAFCTSRAAGEAMLTAALAGPADTRELATWWVRHNDTNLWRDYRLGRSLAPEYGWTDADIVWRSGPVRRGRVPVDADVSGSRRMALVVTPADNGNSCDWADWLEPRLLPRTEDRTSRQNLSGPGALRWASATAGWGRVQDGHNCEGGPLSVEGQVFTEGLGTHAPSEIVFDLPGSRAPVRFTATAAVDDGGTTQGDASPTRVEFIVYADRALQREDEALAAAARRQAQFAVLRDTSRDIDTRVQAAEDIAGDAQGGAVLLSEAAAGRLAALDPDAGKQQELTEALSAAIFRNPDLGVRALASASFQRPGSPTLPPIAELEKLAGDRRAGEALFFGAARCSACHAVRGRGGDVGPDLTQIRNKSGRAQLLDSILNPSAAIGAGFESVTLTLRDGSGFAGLVQADGAQVLLKDAAGARHVIKAGDIVERRNSRLSLMPEDISRDLLPQQLADLCAFLQHDPDAPPSFGPAVELWNGRDLSGWAAVPDASAWSVRDADGTPVLHTDGQPIGYVRTERAFGSFELRVEWRFPDPQRPGNSGVLLRVQAPDKVWPRSLEAQLNSGDAGDIWNIDAFGADMDPARTEGRRTVKLLPSSEKPLGEWNTYRITLRGGDLTLDVNGQVQNRARWCEDLPGSIALQSEGAPIEFRRVTLREIAD